MGAETSGRVGLAVCPGWAWQAREEARLCVRAAVSTFTSCHIEMSCLIEIASIMVCGLALGSKRGAWGGAWCRGVLDIGRPPEVGI